MEIDRPDQAIAALRVKNAFFYIPELANKLLDMTDWLSPGGELIVQNITYSTFFRSRPTSQV